jgi:hypothetical protein
LAFPWQANYSVIVAPYNLDYPAVPAAVAFLHMHVAVLVNCAAESGYKAQAKSGGHSAANYGTIVSKPTKMLPKCEVPVPHLTLC